MSSIIIASGGRIERHCMKCIANKLRREDRDVEQRYSFRTPHGEYVWDVEKALRLVSANAQERVMAGEFISFDAEMMETWMTNLEDDALDIGHVSHVNPTEPGIITQAWDCRQGSVAAVLIDGTHRMARAYQMGLPFHAFILSHDESMSCLLRRPVLAPEIVARMAAMEAFPSPVEG